ncbi:MAG: NADH-quinone oxidoreductase subunit NuoE [Alphaproteobacteria bacterium]|nr:NADH-quinone oxidoreductase subunit NuoE [Alphaproteobacteria bacterium]
MKKLETNNDFSFSQANLKQAKKIISHYPEGRQKSALLPLLDLAQRQNGGWVNIKAIEYIASMLNVPFIKALEVASFYTMINLKPVGKFHIQVCGTTPCWLRGAGDIMRTCKEKLGIEEKETSEDGLFTLSEVECLGACVNAPMVQINDDYYEDLTPEIMNQILDDLKSGKKVKIGSQIGRSCSKAASV